MGEEKNRRDATGARPAHRQARARDRAVESSPLRRAARAAPLILAIAGASALYLPPGVFRGQDLYGSDFLQLHQYRMEFAQEAWAGGFRAVPGWYSREALGTPFSADIQNFPLIPTRLPLLLFPPHAAYAPGVALAAALAVLFTYLLSRRLGARQVAAAAAGFSFAASGFFASRVMAGHLPHLEAYPALPLLLWLAERLVASPPTARARHLVALALGAFCIALAGNPQLPFYSLVITTAYLLWRSPRTAAWPLAALALGCMASLAVWSPTLLLIGRSARLLALSRPDNDVPFPLGRLPALVAPWRDGWPPAVVRSPAESFHGYASDATFWETTSYAGLAPWVAAAALLLIALQQKRASRQALFLTLGAGICALLSLASAQRLFDVVPATVFRSAARLWYLPTLTLALAFGAGVDALLAHRRLRWMVPAVLLLHGADLVAHARPFVRATVGERAPRPLIEDVLQRGASSFRVALDYNLPIAPTRRWDDVGFFASLHLATTYRALLALGHAPERLNVQYLSGARQLGKEALRNCGVRYVASLTRRPDLVQLLVDEGVNLYEVPRPVPRALFFPQSLVRYWLEAEMPDLLLSAALDRVLLLPLAEASRAASSAADAGEPRPAGWRRPSPDVMEVTVETPSPGWIRVLESHDPGWRATLDGSAAHIVRAEGFLMAVRVPPGRHTLRFSYETPGVWAGRLASLGALAALAALVRATAKRT